MVKFHVSNRTFTFSPLRFSKIFLYKQNRDDFISLVTLIPHLYRIVVSICRLQKHTLRTPFAFKKCWILLTTLLPSVFEIPKNVFDFLTFSRNLPITRFRVGNIFRLACFDRFTITVKSESYLKFPYFCSSLLATKFLTNLKSE